MNLAEFLAQQAESHTEHVKVRLDGADLTMQQLHWAADSPRRSSWIVELLFVEGGAALFAPHRPDTLAYELRVAAYAMTQQGIFFIEGEICCSTPGLAQPGVWRPMIVEVIYNRVPATMGGIIHYTP